MLGTSETYRKQITDLTAWFEARLPGLGFVQLTRAEFGKGTDSLKVHHAALVRESFVVWLDDRNYELSYNQTCNAFFAAAENLGLLTIVD